MADKSINDLNFAPGTIDDANTLFVVSQSGTAYKVSGHEYITALGAILDGHGGIKTISYTAPVSPSLDGTLTITLADDDVETLTITNGKGLAASSPVVDYWAASSSNSTTPSTWYTTMQTLTDTNKYLWHYQHYAFNDGTSYDTTKTVIGVYGDKGDNSYVWIRYSGSQPTSDSDMGTTPDDWMGIYTGNESDPSNLHYTDYAWFCIKGETGDTGDPATIVTQNVSYQTSSSGTVAPSGSWTSNIPTVTPGDFLWTRTQIQFNTGNPITTYSVSRYGIDGAGSVSTVNSISPDANGNVALTADDIPMPNNVSVEDTITQIETDVGNVSQLTTSSSIVVGAINELKTSLNTVKSDLGIVEDTNTATHTIAQGQYVIWKDALYTASQAIPLGTTLSASNLTAVSGGGFNSLQGQIDTKTLTVTDIPTHATCLAKQSGNVVTVSFGADDTGIACTPNWTVFGKIPVSACPDADPYFVAFYRIDNDTTLRFSYARIRVSDGAICLYLSGSHTIKNAGGSFTFVK